MLEALCFQVVRLSVHPSIRLSVCPSEYLVTAISKDPLDGFTSYLPQGYPMLSR